MGLILTADIGSSSLKAALIDPDGRLKAIGRAVYDQKPPCAEDWERAFTITLKALNSQAPDCQIVAVCFSGNGPTLVPVTSDGKSLPPVYWNKTKATASVQAERPSLFLPHVSWFKNTAQNEYEQTALFISSHEWLAYRLGGEAFTVLPQASYEPYYWDDEQCRFFDLDKTKFPPFIKTGSVMGYVSAKAAAYFSSYYKIKSGTPIIAGGPDFITALIGTNTLRPGELCDRAGSSEGINFCSSAPNNSKDLRSLPHAIQGLWNLGIIIPASGKLFEQYRINSGQENRPYKELLEELIPDHYIQNGAFPDSQSEKILQGRTVLCDMAKAVRNALETLKSHGFHLSEMRVSGGQGKNPRWNQLKADITGISLLMPEIPDGELAGNAVIAAASLKEACSIEEAASKMIRFREVFTPK